MSDLTQDLLKVILTPLLSLGSNFVISLVTSVAVVVVMFGVQSCH
jgi:hypothetical protein